MTGVAMTETAPQTAQPTDQQPAEEKLLFDQY